MADRSTLDRTNQIFLSIARGMFIERLHVLRLTEVVRHGIRPNEEDILLLPPALDEEMKKLAFDFVLAIFPDDYHLGLIQQRSSWFTPQ